MLNKDEIIELNRQFNARNLDQFGINHIQDALKVLKYNSLEELSKEEIVMMYKALFIVTNIYLVDQFAAEGVIH